MKNLNAFFIGLPFFLMFMTALFYLGIRESIKDHQERAWYVRKLDYEFCCVITNDIKRLPIRGDLGIVECRFSDNVGYKLENLRKNYEIEEELQDQLVQNDHLWFLLSWPTLNKIEFVIPGASIYQKNDSICVSAQDDKVALYRGGTLISNQTMSGDLYGF